MRNDIAILDYTNFFTDNIKVHKNSQKGRITFKNGNCIKCFKNIKIKENEVISEIIKVDKSLENYEIEDLIKNNLLKYELVMILKDIKDENDLQDLTFLSTKLNERNCRTLNILYINDKSYKNKDINVKAKIIIPLKEDKNMLFNESISIYNSILNLMNNNEKILFNLCNEENIPMLNLNIDNVKNIGEGVLEIIKRFKNIQYLDVLILTLISKKKVSIEDIYYIKDPLEEYMDYNKEIIVQELIEDNYKENLTINLIGLR